MRNIHKQMINKLFKNWFILLSVVTIVWVLVLSYTYPELWMRESFRENFFKIGFYLCGLIAALWMFQHHKLLFEKGNYLRSLAICSAAAAVFLWTYKHKVTFRMDLLLLFCSGLYSLVYRKWIKPDAVMITFFALMVLKYLGILWSVDKTFAWQEVDADGMYLLLLAPIVCIGFRPKAQETMSFITLSFRMFLLLLTLNIATYIIVHRIVGVPFFSFFTFNKGYMAFTEHILAWTFFKHPSFIAWVMFTIWGLGVWVWRKSSKYLSLAEVVWYGVLLFCFAFIMQARIVIVGFPLAVLLMGWFYISKRWVISRRAITEIGMVVVGILGIYLLVTHSTYFADPIREKMLAKAFDSIMANPIVGKGTIYEKLVAKEAIGQIHIHNDFLATLIDLGMIGLIVILLWVFFVYRKAILSKDDSIAYCLMTFLLLMNTDVMLNYLPGIYITLPFLIMVFFKEKPRELTI